MSWLTQITLDPLELDPAESPQVAPRPQQRLDLVFARNQLMHKIRTDKTRRAGNEAVHGDNLASFRCVQKQKSRGRAPGWGDCVDGITEPVLDSSTAGRLV